MLHSSMDPDLARDTFARQVGPRRPGGTYHSALLGIDYIVLDERYGRTAGTNRGWVLTIQPLDAKTPGSHTVAWDYQRDQVLAEPIPLHRNERVVVIPPHADGDSPWPVAARATVTPGLLAVHVPAADADGPDIAWWIVHHSGHAVAGYPSAEEAEFGAEVMAFLTDWTKPLDIVRDAVNPLDLWKTIERTGGVQFA